MALAAKQRHIETKAHIPKSFVGDVPENPLPTSARRNSQIERTAVSEHSGLLGSRYLEHRQSIECTSHSLTFAHIREADTNRRSRLWIGYSRALGLT
jgi:hypothetical protein